MKRGMAGRGRKGAPPLPRQRVALRVVQVTLLGVAAFLGRMAYAAYLEVGAGMSQVVGPAVLAATFAAAALWMGVRTVRGPQPPDLDG